MKTSPLGPFRLVLSLSLFLLLVSTTLSAESPPSAGTTLAAHLATLEQVAGRLQRQIAHPEGRPEAEEELAFLIDHLERLQVATAATEAELGTQLEDLRLSLLGRIRRGHREAREATDDEAAIAKKAEDYRLERERVQTRVKWTLTLFAPLLFAAFGLVRWRRRESAREAIRLD